MDHASATVSWPDVAWKILPWRPWDGAALSARQRFHLLRTYDSAVVPNIADAVIELPTEVMTCETAAVSAIARFDTTAVCALLPFTPLLLRSESSASLRIERLTSSVHRIMEEKIFGSDCSSGNASLIAANTRVTEAATTTPWPLGPSSLLSIHRVLLGNSALTITSRPRQESVWIGSLDLSPAGTMSVPPHHRRTPNALEDLLSSLRRSDLPPSTKVALAHAQLETVHPFADGSDCIGRVLIHVVLSGEGLSLNAPLPLSVIPLTNVGTCFRALDKYRAGALLAAVELFIDAAQHAAELGARTSREFDGVHRQMQDHVPSRAGTPDRDLIRHLVSHPVTDVRGVVAAVGVSEQAARRALERLETTGILRGYQVSRGRRAWRTQDVLDLTDEVVEGLGHRQAPADV